MELPGWLRTRVRLVGRLYGRQLARISLALYAVLAFADWAIGVFGPPWLIRRVRLGDNLPDLTIWQWLCIGLGLLLVIGFEGAYRLIGTASKGQPTEGPKTPILDPAHAELVRRLRPLVEQAVFLMKRRARRDQHEPPGFYSEVRTWAAKVSTALDGFPHWKTQFESEPAYSSIDDDMGRFASRELEHRYEMLEVILDAIRGAAER